MRHFPLPRKLFSFFCLVVLIVSGVVLRQQYLERLRAQEVETAYNFARLYGYEDENLLEFSNLSCGPLTRRKCIAITFSTSMSIDQISTIARTQTVDGPFEHISDDLIMEDNFSIGGFSTAETLKLVRKMDAYTWYHMTDYDLRAVDVQSVAMDKTVLFNGNPVSGNIVIAIYRPVTHLF